MNNKVKEYLELRLGTEPSVYKTTAIRALDIQKEEIISIIEQKLKEVNPNVNSEFDFCEISGYGKGLKECIEIIKNS